MTRRRDGSHAQAAQVVRAWWLRSVALAAALALALSTLVSGVLIEELHDHRCAGDDCAYCHVIRRAEGMLESAGTALAASAHVAVAFAPLALAVALCVRLSVAETPVRRKVRLDI